MAEKKNGCVISFTVVTIVLCMIFDILYLIFLEREPSYFNHPLIMKALHLLISTYLISEGVTLRIPTHMTLFDSLVIALTPPLLLTVFCYSDIYPDVMLSAVVTSVIITLIYGMMLYRSMETNLMISALRNEDDWDQGEGERCFVCSCWNTFIISMLVLVNLLLFLAQEKGGLSI